MLSTQDPRSATVFADIVAQRPSAPAVLPEAQPRLVRSESAVARRAALTIGCFTTVRILFAWWLPLRRI